MRDITGAAGAIGPNFVIRDDQPLHDLTGANTWVPQMLPLHPVFSQTFFHRPGPPGCVERWD